MTLIRAKGEQVFQDTVKCGPSPNRACANGTHRGVGSKTSQSLPSGAVSLKRSPGLIGEVRGEACFQDGAAGVGEDPQQGRDGRPRRHEGGRLAMSGRRHSSPARFEVDQQFQPGDPNLAGWSNLPPVKAPVILQSGGEAGDRRIRMSPVVVGRDPAGW